MRPEAWIGTVELELRFWTLVGANLKLHSIILTFRELETLRTLRTQKEIAEMTKAVDCFWKPIPWYSSGHLFLFPHYHAGTPGCGIWVKTTVSVSRCQQTNPNLAFGVVFSVDTFRKSTGR